MGATTPTDDHSAPATPARRLLPLAPAPTLSSAVDPQIVLATTLAMDAERNASSRRRANGVKSKRGKNYTEEEAMTLAKNWVFQKELCPKQKDLLFWHAVELRCREEGVQRSASSLKTMWSQFSRNSARYIEARQQVRCQATSDDDMHSKAMKLYVKMYKTAQPDGRHDGSDFKFVDAALYLATQTRFTTHYKCGPQHADALRELWSARTPPDETQRSPTEEVGAGVIDDERHEDDDGSHSASADGELPDAPDEWGEGACALHVEGGARKRRRCCERLCGCCCGVSEAWLELCELRLAYEDAALHVRLARALPAGTQRDDALADVMTTQRALREQLGALRARGEKRRRLGGAAVAEEQQKTAEERAALRGGP